VRIVIGPFQRNFKENGLELLHAILDAWAGWSSGGGGRAMAVGTLKMEAFFARHGTPRQVRFDAVKFEREGGRRLLWLVPELHPGPYADIGGSDLPSKAASWLAGAADDFAVFHGPSTHDENPTGREQLAKVLAKVRESVEGAAGSATASKAVRAKSAHFTVTAQRIAGALVLAQSRAPLSSDDMDPSVGREIREACARAGFPHTVVLDGHNSVERDLGRIQGGSPEVDELVALCAEAAKKASGHPEEPLRVGWAVVLPSEAERREYAVGPQGVVSAVIEVGGQKTAWVLIDGNNLKGGLRSEMLEAVKGKVDLAEVFTTDNHAVNTTMGADNEVGSRRDNVRLVEMVREGVERAASDLAPARACPVAGAAPDIQVFGPGLTVRISATINGAVSVMGPAYLATTAAAVLACVTMVLLLT
jgi:putative membrane protein